MRSKELWLVEKNHATVKLSNLIRASLLVEWKLTAKAELQILKKMQEKSSQFLLSEQPCAEPKSFDVALKIAGVEKIPSENLIRVLDELKGA